MAVKKYNNKKITFRSIVDAHTFLHSYKFIFMAVSLVYIR